MHSKKKLSSDDLIFISKNIKGCKFHNSFSIKIKNDYSLNYSIIDITKIKNKLFDSVFVYLEYLNSDNVSIYNNTFFIKITNSTYTLKASNLKNKSYSFSSLTELLGAVNELYVHKLKKENPEWFDYIIKDNIKKNINNF